MRNPRVIIGPDPEGAARKGLEILTRSAREDLTRRETFALALSGGRTPRTLHRMLADPEHQPLIPWSQTHIFWVDERCVAPSHPASNYGTALGDFLDRPAIDPHQVHPMRGNLPPEQGARVYAEELRAFLPLDQSSHPVLDLIFLGVGTDGHIGSLFPRQPALDEPRKWVVAVSGGEPHLNRLTLTLPVINAARRIVFLVTGQKKATVVKAVLEERDRRLPAARVQPGGGRLIWILDRGAASALRQTRNLPAAGNHA